MDYFEKVLLESTAEAQSMHMVSFIDDVTQGNTPLYKEWLVESYKHYNGLPWHYDSDNNGVTAKSKTKSVIQCNCAIF